MAMTGLERARAIAVFNPTALPTGFLQPLFAGPSGDNKSYVQILRDPATINRFLPVAWPERDCTMIEEELVAAAGGESLWGFVFPGEAPLVLPWSRFREVMRDRLDDEALSGNPLLAFDIVDTLDLVERKRAVFSRAFERYGAIDREAAERWRDRAILEPALAKVVSTIRSRDARPSSVTDMSVEPTAYMRARLSDGQVTVMLEQLDGGVERALNDAYQALRASLPELFPEDVEVTVRHRSRPEQPQPTSSTITIVIVGRIRKGDVQHDKWAQIGVEVVDADHFQSERRTRRGAPLTIIVGAHADWPHMVELGGRMSGRRAVYVTLSNSVPPIKRDLKFQEAAQHPTITFFAPFATSSDFKRDSVQQIAPLVEILREESADNKDRPLPKVTQHRTLMRESVWADQGLTEASCRLSARALRAGTLVGAQAKLYLQGRFEAGDQSRLESAFSLLFDLQATRSLAEFERRRAAMLLLVERATRFESNEASRRAHPGVRELFEMRGWRILSEDSSGLRIGDGQREFSVAVLDQGQTAPSENPVAPTPALGRAALLVVHMQPKREELLVGNRGEFFHIATEDIALMAPDSPWIWPVLRRHLFEAKGRLALASLRLSAALVVEAIRMNRVQTSFVDVDWEEVERVMSADDCERFVDFHGRRAKNGHALIVADIANNQSPPRRGPAVIGLVIHDKGPFVSASVDLNV